MVRILVRGGVSAGVALVAGLVMTAGLAAQDVRKLTILHSNDLHARLAPDERKTGGFAYLATVVRQQRQGCTECLYLNAGDLVQGTPVSTIFKGVPVYEVANRLGFDASTLGNHEFDYGYRQVRDFIRTANFPVISANVVDKEGRLLAPRAYLIKEVNGLRVGIIGVSMGDLVSGFLMPVSAGPYNTRPVVETVKKYAAELKDKTDILVVLGHIHAKEGSAVIREVPEVDAVIEGHSHAGRTEMEDVDHRVAVGCRGYGVELCRLDLEVDRATKKLVSAKWTRFPVNASVAAPAPDVQALVEKWERKVAERVNTKIGEAAHAFNKEQLRVLMEKAIKDEMPADFTFVNLGGIRDVLPQGEVLERHIWNIMPFDNMMMTSRVKGSQLTKFLREGETVEPDKVYTLAIYDYLVNNENSRASLGLEGIQFQPTNILFRDLLIAWVKKQGVLQ